MKITIKTTKIPWNHHWNRQNPIKSPLKPPKSHKITMFFIGSTCLQDLQLLQFMEELAGRSRRWVGIFRYKNDLTTKHGGISATKMVIQRPNIGILKGFNRQKGGLNLQTRWFYIGFIRLERPTSTKHFTTGMQNRICLNGYITNSTVTISCHSGEVSCVLSSRAGGSMNARWCPILSVKLVYKYYN